MLTSFGRCLRKLRIDRNENMLDMANRLGVSKSFLSAVEHGQKHIPSLWAEDIAVIYGLDKIKEDELAYALVESNNKIELSLQNIPEENKKLAFYFAKNFDKLNKGTISKITKLIEEGGDE